APGRPRAHDAGAPARAVASLHRCDRRPATPGREPPDGPKGDADRGARMGHAGAAVRASARGPYARVAALPRSERVWAALVSNIRARPGDRGVSPRPVRAARPAAALRVAAPGLANREHGPLVRRAPGLHGGADGRLGAVPAAPLPDPPHRADVRPPRPRRDAGIAFSGSARRHLPRGAPSR